MQTHFPHLEQVSKESGIPTDVLIEIFKLESDFNIKINQESSYEKRQELSAFVYNKVPSLIPIAPDRFEKLVDIKTKIVHQFRKDIQNKSILDIGSGVGAFLYAVKKTGIPTGEVYGLDVKAAQYAAEDEYSKAIKFFQQSIIDFNLNKTFDFIILDNVYEHISFQDQPIFYKSLKSAVHKGTKMVLILPHRMFGPTDFTRIIDNSHSGKTLAQCVHLNESTFTEVINDLEQQGFGNFKTTFPFIAFQGLRNIFPNFRISADVFRFYENSVLNKILSKVRYKNRPLFRMEVLIIAEYLG